MQLHVRILLTGIVQWSPALLCYCFWLVYNPLTKLYFPAWEKIQTMSVFVISNGRWYRVLLVSSKLAFACVRCMLKHSLCSVKSPTCQYCVPYKDTRIYAYHGLGQQKEPASLVFSSYILFSIYSIALSRFSISYIFWFSEF